MAVPCVRGSVYGFSKPNSVAAAELLSRGVLERTGVRLEPLATAVDAVPLASNGSTSGSVPRVGVEVLERIVARLTTRVRGAAGVRTLTI